jgi:hypothetical protein
MKHRNIIFAFMIAIFLIVSGCAAKTPLIKASASGDSSAVQKLINEGSNVNEPDGNGYTPLIHAVWSQNIETVKVLLNKGADINAKDKGGYTPLLWASSYSYLDIAKLLIDKGADVNAKDSFGNTALMSASIPAIAKILIDKGADVNAQNKTGLTALHNIVGFYDNNNIVIAEYLLNKNASANLKDENGQTALRYAISSKNIDMVALIRRKTNSIEETESLYMNDALGKPSHYNPEKGMFDVPADKEQAYKLAVYDCNLMVTFDKGVLTIITGPVGYLGSMAADAIMIKGKFQKCMAKMGFECKNNCSK